MQRFLFSISSSSINTLDVQKIKAFLSSLVLHRNVCKRSKSTQNVALNAIVYFFKHALDKPLGDFEHIRSARPPKSPTVLTPNQFNTVLDAMSGTHLIMAEIMYGAVLRLIECVRLRVKDIDFEHTIIQVIDGKGGKHRRVQLHVKCIDKLQVQLEKVATMHHKDLAAGFGAVFLPHALARKFASAAKELHWQ